MPGETLYPTMTAATETNPTPANPPAADPAPAPADPAPIPPSPTPEPSTEAAPVLPGATEPAQPPPAAIDYSKLQAPDGKPTAVLEGVREVAAKYGVSLEAAQALVTGIEARFTASIAAAEADEARVREECKRQILADPAIGGEAGLAQGAAVLKSHGDSELHELLEQSGLIDHPAVARFLVKVGKDLGESPMLPMGGAVRSQADVHRLMYPNSPGMFTQQ